MPTARETRQLRRTMELLLATLRRKSVQNSELKLARDNKKVFSKYVNSKPRTRETTHPLVDEDGQLTSRVTYKTETFNAFFVIVFNTSGKALDGDCDCRNNELQDNLRLLWYLLLQLDAYKSMLNPIPRMGNPEMLSTDRDSWASS